MVTNTYTHAHTYLHTYIDIYTYILTHRHIDTHGLRELIYDTNINKDLVVQG
jgi:hypothetical protein